MNTFSIVPKLSAKAMEPDPNSISSTGGLFSLLSQQLQSNSPHLEFSEEFRLFLNNHGIRLSLPEVEALLSELLPPDPYSPIANILSGKQILKENCNNPAAVAFLQDRLRNLGFIISDDNHNARGRYSPQTQRAVRQFQRVLDLKQDGMVGPNTMKAILAARPLDLPQGLSKKPGAIIFALNQQIIKILPDIVSVWQNLGAPLPVITSGNDSQHAKGSKHYLNWAIDLRGNNVSDGLLRKMAKELKKELGDDYIVIAEFFPKNPANDHIHIQYHQTDPQSLP